MDRCEDWSHRLWWARICGMWICLRCNRRTGGEMRQSSRLEVKVNREHARRVLAEAQVFHDAQWWRNIALSWASMYLDITTEEGSYNSGQLEEFQPIKVKE